MDLISELFLEVMVDTDNGYRTMDSGWRTTLGVSQKLPTDELTIRNDLDSLNTLFKS